MICCICMQIIHLKRFQFLSNRWIKSQKCVDFPLKDFDPESYLVPRSLASDHSHISSEEGAECTPDISSLVRSV